MTDQTGELTVFYDGSCRLCTAEIRVYRTSAGAHAVSFVDVSAHSGGLVAPGLVKETALKRFHVCAVDGTLVSGAEGFGHLWLALPEWRWLGRFVLLPVVLPVAEVVYRGFLVVRPELQLIFRAKSRPGTPP